MSEFDRFMKNIEQMTKFFSDEKNHGLVNDSFLQSFETRQRQLFETADEILKENRSLRIGIVGQVKAGKSSFLNAMLFDGEDILPRAATPMTAALTKIVYAEQAYAKVVYFTETDWQAVENGAKKYDIAFERIMSVWEEDQRRIHLASMGQGIDLSMASSYGYMRDRQEKVARQQINEVFTAFKEVHQLAEKSVVPYEQVVGQEVVVPIDNLKQDLADYVGAEGGHTPFVKYIELGIKNEMLKQGIEIVDTPGMGDPIISRSQTTKDFLMQCDMVFVLSQTSQFLNKEDVELIKKTLPRDNIQQAVLIGTKFDSVLLDDSSRQRLTLSDAARRTMLKLNKHAQSTLESAKKAAGDKVKVLESLQNQDPQYVSALLYSAARKKIQAEEFNKQEDLTLNNLVERFDGMETDATFLLELSNIDAVRDKQFKLVREQKDNILTERRGTLFNSQCIEFLRQMDDIQNEAEINLQSVKSGDVGSLAKKLQMSRNALTAMRHNIRNIFEYCGIEAKKYLVQLSSEMQSIADKHTVIKTQEQKKEKNCVATHLFSKDEHWIEVLHYTVASVSDAIDNINHYIVESESHLASELSHALDIQSIRNKVKEAVLKAFHQSDASFDENDILGPVEVVLAEITIPPFTLVDRMKYNEKISQQFTSAQVQGEEIHDLYLLQTQVLQEIQKDIREALEKIANNVKQVLDAKAISFTDDVQKQIENKIEILQLNISDKETSIHRYDEFLRNIRAEKARLLILTEESK